MTYIDCTSPTSVELVFDDLVRCETRLYNLLSDALRAEHQMSLGAFEVVRYVLRNPGSRVSDVAAAFALGAGATSRAIDRVCVAGHLRRVPNPADRRSSLLEATEDGIRQIRAAEQTYLARLATVIEDTLGTDAFISMAGPVRELRRTLEEADIGQPAG